MDDLPLPPIEQRYDEAPCGLLTAGPDGRLLHVNATLCRWLAYPPEALVGVKRLQDLFTMGGRIFHQTHLLPLLRMQGSVAEVKLELVRSDGEVIPMLLNVRERAHEGRPLLHAAVFQAQDRHRYEQELVLQRQRAEELAAQHARDQEALAAAHDEVEARAQFAEQLVGVVSHDIRNPLSVIDLSTRLLRKLGLADRQEAVVDRVERAVGTLQHLIADLLDFTQARLGRGLSIAAEDADLHQCVADAVAQLALAFPQQPIRHVASGGGAWRADPKRIAQAVGNLVANAVKHGAPGAPVTVATRPDGEAFLVDVHNEGPAIPPEAVAALFLPMVRGHERRSAGDGVGLGLYIVDRIVRGHGGSVRVRSEPEQGTTFTLVLPRAEAGAIRSPSPA